MRYFLLPLLMLALAYSEGPAEEPITVSTEAARKDSISMILFDFAPAGYASEETAWQVVNDGVMGGRSQGFVEIKEGTLRFSGTLVTQGGGFTSVRANRAVDLTGYDGLELRVRGGGRTFEVDVGDNLLYRGRSISRRAPFETTEEWALVRVPFSALETSIFGQPVAAPPVDLANVKQISLYILDGQDGPFRLEIDSIRAYRTDAD